MSIKNLSIAKKRVNLEDTLIIPNPKRLEGKKDSILFAGEVFGIIRGVKTKMNIVFIKSSSVNGIWEAIEGSLSRLNNELLISKDKSEKRRIRLKINEVYNLRVDLNNISIQEAPTRELVSYVGKQEGLSHIKKATDILLMSRELV